MRFSRCLLSGAILRNPLLTGTATVQQVEKDVMLWLRGACDREGGRKRRMLQKAIPRVVELEIYDEARDSAE